MAANPLAAANSRTLERSQSGQPSVEKARGSFTGGFLTKPLTSRLAAVLEIKCRRESVISKNLLGLAASLLRLTPYAKQSNFGHFHFASCCSVVCSSASGITLIRFCA